MKVFVTGVSGMDGSFLADKYIAKGVTVIGIDRWSATGVSCNIKHLIGNPNFKLITGDITEFDMMTRLIRDEKPDIIYNMGAISLVPESFRVPFVTFQTNTMAVVNMLEAIRTYSPSTKYYQASTSEQIGANKNIPQNTESLMLPTSPYAVAKLASYHIVRVYRNAFNIFAVNGLLHNHESERRGPDFVTRKITLAVANIYNGKQDKLTLGNMDSYRDWGYAPDFVEAMIKMMEHDKPDDYAVNTGECHSIREFVEEAFRVAGMNITWKGKCFDEQGFDDQGVLRVDISKEFYRPAEVDLLCGDHSKIQKHLGWVPKIKFKELVRKMVEHDIDNT